MVKGKFQYTITKKSYCQKTKNWEQKFGQSCCWNSLNNFLWQEIGYCYMNQNVARFQGYKKGRRTFFDKMLRLGAISLQSQKKHEKFKISTTK